MVAVAWETVSEWTSGISAESKIWEKVKCVSENSEAVKKWK